MIPMELYENIFENIIISCENCGWVGRIGDLLTEDAPKGCPECSSHEEGGRNFYYTMFILLNQGLQIGKNVLFNKSKSEEICPLRHRGN